MSRSLIETGDKKAVLIGINNYLDTSINKLNYSVSDIVSFYEILIDKQRGGFNPDNVKMLIDGKNGPDEPIRSNIMSAIQSLSQSVSSEDSILLYFSGHGLEKNNENYIVCQDSRYNVLEDTAIPVKWLKQTLIESNARVKIIIFDACHSGALIGKSESGIMTRSLYETLFPAPEGFAVLSSCRLNESSHEWPEFVHGVFSYYLLEGLRGAADGNKDKLITITEANKYISDKVKSWAFTHSKQQNPTLECKISGDILISKVPELEVVAQEIEVDKSVIQSITLIQETFKIGTNPKISAAEDKKKAQPIIEERINKLCGILVQNFYESDKIIYESDTLYKHPNGNIEVVSNYPTNEEYEVKILVNFIYKRESWDNIDFIIELLDNYKNPGWMSLIYNFTKEANISILIKKCKEIGFKIESYSPKPPITLEISVKGWGTAKSNVRFQNTEYGLSVKISPSIYVFDFDFYDSINPKNIIEFLTESFI